MHRDALPGAPLNPTSIDPMGSQLLESLDYLYVPAPDFEAAVAFYTGTLGGRLRWRIRHGSTWVAAVRLADASPLVLLANHLEPGQLLLIYRTRSLAEVQHALSNVGWAVDGSAFELPQGPCVIFRDPGGQRVAVYERLRPEVEAAFEGRFDRL
jgi:catechol 2,3-dioxygenase-like lactoylglutathione lyase family enzyme